MPGLDTLLFDGDVVAEVLVTPLALLLISLDRVLQAEEEQEVPESRLRNRYPYLVSTN